MNYRFLILSLFAGIASVCMAIDISPSKYQGGSTNDIPNKSDGAPSLLHSPFKWVFGEPRSEAMKRVQAPPNFKLELATEPRSFVPSTNACLKVKMTAVNEGKDKYILEFNSAQHYDFVITKMDGKEVYRWSANKSFSQQTSSIVLNHNEKAVYEEQLFSPSNQITSLPPADYKLKGMITSKTPISVETLFWIAP
jgi:hypothetical protein